MSEDGMNKRRKALEDGYFAKQNEEALKRLQQRATEGEGAQRPSPITGTPMEQMTFMGVNIDKCKDTGGVWLDKGELEQIIEAAKTSVAEDDQSWGEKFFSFLSS